MQNLLFIDGRFVPAVDRGEIEVLNPADGSSITRIAAAEAADVDLASTRLAALFRPGPGCRRRSAAACC